MSIKKQWKHLLIAQPDGGVAANATLSTWVRHDQIWRETGRKNKDSQPFSDTYSMKSVIPDSCFSTGVLFSMIFFSGIPLQSEDTSTAQAGTKI